MQESLEKNSFKYVNQQQKVADVDFVTDVYGRWSSSIKSYVKRKMLSHIWRQIPVLAQ